MSRVIFFMYTGEYVPTAVPEIFQQLCADPDEFALVGSAMEAKDAARSKDLHTENVQDAKISAMVYACADMTMIENLKKAAGVLFYYCASAECLHKLFHDALRTMYQVVPANDKDLRFRVEKMLLRDYTRWQRDPKTYYGDIDKEAIAVLDEYTGGWWGLATEQLGKLHKRHKESMKKVEGTLTAKVLSKVNKGWPQRDKLKEQALRLADGVAWHPVLCEHEREVRCRPTFQEFADYDEQEEEEEWKWRFDFIPECDECEPCRF